MAAVKGAARGLWVFGSSGGVRACGEAAFARGVRRALDGKGLSRGFMAACAGLFFQVFDGECGFVPVGLARTMGAAARVRVLAALANGLATLIKNGGEMRGVGEASAWLVGALTRSVGSLVGCARQIGGVVVPGAVAAAWAAGKVLAVQYIRAVSALWRCWPVGEGN